MLDYLIKNKRGDIPFGKIFLSLFSFIFLIFLTTNVSALFVGNNTIHSDGVYNYTANRDFNVTSLNYSIGNFQIDGVPYCAWENKSFFNTARICFDNTTIIDENGSIVSFADANNSINNSGVIVKGTNATFNVTITNQTTISKVWIKIWNDAIGGVVKTMRYLTNLRNNVWQIIVSTNSTFNNAKYNYTIYSNTTNGINSNFNANFNTSDSIAPIFISTIISPAVVINGSNVTINANVSDNVQVDSIWASITLPNGSSQFISAGNLPYNYTTPANLFGTYNVTYYANDSSGNNATVTKSFKVAQPTNMTINTTVEVGTKINVASEINLIVYTHETDNKIATRKKINGSESIVLPDVPVDLFFNTTFGNDTRSTKINNLNISASQGKGISFSDPVISGYLTVYGVHTDLVFDNATIEISYNNSGYSDENNLQLWKCDNFNITSGICLGSFRDITSSANQNTTDKKFTYVTTSFSGFAIKQYIPPTITETPSTNNGGGGGGGCAPDYKRIGLKCIKVKEKIKKNITKNKIPDKLFNITLSLNDTSIQNPNDLSAIVTFKNFGSLPTNVNLTFMILDKSGNEYAVDKNSIVVTTEKVLRKKFKSLHLPDGEYTLILKTLYNGNVSNEFKQEFRISSKKRGISGDVIESVNWRGKWGLIGIFGLIILGILMGFVIKKTRKSIRTDSTRKIK